MDSDEQKVFIGLILAKIDAARSKTITIQEFRDLAKFLIERDGRTIETTDKKPSLNWTNIMLRKYKNEITRANTGISRINSSRLSANGYGTKTSHFKDDINRIFEKGTIVGVGNCDETPVGDSKTTEKIKGREGFTRKTDETGGYPNSSRSNFCGPPHIVDWHRSQCDNEGQ